MRSQLIHNLLLITAIKYKIISLTTKLIILHSHDFQRFFLLILLFNLQLLSLLKHPCAVSCYESSCCTDK